MSIVVPTLREAANLRPLAERIARVLAGRDIAWELLFVDDDSGDGSATVAAGLAERHLGRLCLHVVAGRLTRRPARRR